MNNFIESISGNIAMIPFLAVAMITNTKAAAAGVEMYRNKGKIECENFHFATFEVRFSENRELCGVL